MQASSSSPPSDTLNSVALHHAGRVAGRNAHAPARATLSASVALVLLVLLAVVALLALAANMPWHHPGAAEASAAQMLSGLLAPDTLLVAFVAEACSVAVALHKASKAAPAVWHDCQRLAAVRGTSGCDVW